MTDNLQDADTLNDHAIEMECPGCNTDDPAEFRNGCEDPWHAEAAAEATP